MLSLLNILKLIATLRGPAKIVYEEIENYFNEQQQRKVKAIVKAFPKKYTTSELNKLYQTNKQEFNRLYKLSTDEFFRKYIEEQADHKKAQKLIVELQADINEMREKIKYLMKEEQKYRNEIRWLKDEIKILEDVVYKWKKKSA